MLSAAVGMLVNCTPADDTVSAFCAWAFSARAKKPVRAKQIINR